MAFIGWFLKNAATQGYRQVAVQQALAGQGVGLQLSRGLVEAERSLLLALHIPYDAARSISSCRCWSLTPHNSAPRTHRMLAAPDAHPVRERDSRCSGGCDSLASGPGRRARRQELRNRPQQALSEDSGEPQ
jgi:hypothetical protein